MSDNHPQCEGQGVILSAPMHLDEKGRCCGRKPLVYKSRFSTPTGPHRYCPKCDRAYDLHENEQIDNWAWKKVGDQFQCQTSRKDK